MAKAIMQQLKIEKLHTTNRSGNKSVRLINLDIVLSFDEILTTETVTLLFP